MRGWVLAPFHTDWPLLKREQNPASANWSKATAEFV